MADSRLTELELKLKLEKLLKYKVQQKALTLAEMQAFLQRRKDEANAAQQEITNCSEELRRLHEKRNDLRINTTVQIVLKPDQVEASASMDADFLLCHKSTVDNPREEIKDINTPFITTNNVQKLGDGDNTEFETVFVLTDFNSPDYNYLYKHENRIVGPPVVLHCAAKDEKNLVNLVHHMGGIIRKDFSTEVTHLISNSTHGEKYRLAVCMGTPILQSSWIQKAWEKRDQVDFHANEEEFRTLFKVPPFKDCILSFLGFSEEEKAHMEERTQKHGGQYLEVGDERCTHMVVEENSVKDLPISPSKKLFVVKQEWFWGSILMDARAGESMYLYKKGREGKAGKKGGKDLTRVQKPVNYQPKSCSKKRQQRVRGHPRVQLRFSPRSQPGGKSPRSSTRLKATM